MSSLSPLDALRRLVDGWVSTRLDRLALYPARVVSQAADGTLDLVPDDPRVPPCTGVPIRMGLPGASATVPAGGRVLLGYEAGDPSKPCATLWESGTVTVLTLNGGARGAARDGEPVASSASMSAWITAVSALLNSAGAVIGAPGAVTPPTGAIGAVSGGSAVLRLP